MRGVLLRLWRVRHLERVLVFPGDGGGGRTSLLRGNRTETYWGRKGRREERGRTVKSESIHVKKVLRRNKYPTTRQFPPT